MKPPFGGAEHVLAYLAAYTHRIAISNQRILAFDGETVTFSWRDYADGNQEKVMSLPAVEFLRRFATHIVPPRFTRIRYYGFLANCVRSANLERARQFRASRRAPREIVRYAPLCPRCRKGTILIAARAGRGTPTRKTPRAPSPRPDGDASSPHAAPATVVAQERVAADRFDGHRARSRKNAGGAGVRRQGDGGAAPALL